MFFVNTLILTIIYSLTFVFPLWPLIALLNLQTYFGHGHHPTFDLLSTPLSLWRFVWILIKKEMEKYESMHIQCMISINMTIIIYNNNRNLNQDVISRFIYPYETKAPEK